MTNIFYFDNINEIGGVESFFYYLVKANKDKDITIYYDTADDKQLKRLKEYVRVKKYKGEIIECEKAYFNYNPKIINNVKAKEYIMILHTNYINNKPHTHSKITKYIAVSKSVADSFYKHTGIKAKVIYNPIKLDKPKKVLKLVSATRLAKEKQKENYIKFGEKLNREGIPYIWLIFTNDKEAIKNPNIIYMKPTLDIINYIANADYLVQLTEEDREGYSYTINESLCLGTPIISTKQIIYEEMGINDEYGFIIDINNIPANEIYNKKFNFKYTPPMSKWSEELGESKNTYQEEKNKIYLVKANNTCRNGNIYDTERNVFIKPNEEWEISGARLEEISHRVEVIKCIN